MPDQRVVIIGGSSGMGLATAGAAAAAGAAVTIASSDRARLNEALATLPSGCEGVVCDVRSDADLDRLFSQVGELDHLVYTAAHPFGRRPFGELTLEGARQVFEVTYWGAVAAVLRAAPQINPGGSIVLTSGTIGVRPTPGTAMAASGVSAMEGLTRGLAVDLAPIRVNAVRPGVIRTPMWNQVPEPNRTALFASLAQERMLTDAVGEPADIAATHLYLMCNRFVTGTVITVDGGWILTGT